MSFIMKCPECGEEMEKGYLLDVFGIKWSKVKRRWDTFDAEKLFDVSIFDGSVLNVEAYRCKKCKRVTFSYRDAQTHLWTPRKMEDIEINVENLRGSIKELYELLLIYYGDEKKLSKKLREIMKWGWNLEVAIQRLANEEEIKWKLGRLIK